MRSRSVLKLTALPLLLASGACAHGAGTAMTATPESRHHYSPGDLWFEPVSVFGGPVWFSDELVPVTDALVEVLSRPEYGFHVIPPADLRALWANAQQGRLPGVPFICEAPPPPALLAEAVYAGASRAEAEIRCEESSCELKLTLHRGDLPANGAPEDTTRFTEQLRVNGTPAQWAEDLRSGALKQLPPEPPIAGLLGALSGGIAPGLAVYVGDVTTSGGWKRPPDSALLKPFGPALNACQQPGKRWGDWWGQPFLIEVDEAGHATRCEYQYPDHLPPPFFACQCDVLRKVAFGAGQGARRASFDLSVRDWPAGEPKAPSDNVIHTGYLEELSSPDRTAVLGGEAVPTGALAKCLEPIHQPMEALKLPVSFDVGADGRARSHQLQWPPTLPKEVTQCLDRVLDGARFNCPLSGATTASASLELNVASLADSVDEAPADDEETDAP